MNRHTLRLDTALLERRLWLQTLAQERGCTIEEARAIEREDRFYWRMWYIILSIGVALTLGLLVGCPGPEDFTDTGVGCVDCLDRLPEERGE
jgi:hypothetical protein